MTIKKRLASKPTATNAFDISFANPFQRQGKWLKGNTHTHTIYSDGKWTPEEVQRKYGRYGYDFVFITDHWIRTVPSKSFKKPLLIPAEEVDFILRGNMYHVVCLGLRHTWPRRSFRSLNEFIRLANKRRIYLIMAHPYWCGSRSETYVRAEDFPAMEVYNTDCDMGVAKGYSATYWDDCLTAGKRVLGIAADDAHHAARAAGGWIMVKADTCTEPAILSALRQGYFYATQGPQIHDIRIADGFINVACSPVSRINFMTNSHYGAVVRAKGKQLTATKWEIPLSANYVRIECVDRNGKTAWSNPVWLIRNNRRIQAIKRRTMQQAVAPAIRGIPPHGDLTRVKWSSAGVLTNWRSLTGETTHRQVEARLIHDDRYLYIRLEERLNPSRLVVTRNTVWDEDEWELFFAKQPGRPYRQMGVNANGVHLDFAHGETSGIWASNAVVLSQTHHPNRWQVHIALPLARLVRGGARPGHRIYLNIIRSTEAKHALGWIPTFGGYHEPGRLGAVLLQ